MSLQRLLWPAGGIAVAVSFANTTVYAAEEKTKMQTLYKPSEVCTQQECSSSSLKWFSLFICNMVKTLQQIVDRNLFNACSRVV